MPASSDVVLRDVEMEDLPIFFVHQTDADANRMAAFTSADPSNWRAFEAHWQRLLDDPAIVKKTVEHDGQVAGHIMIFPQDGNLEVTYWIGASYWGRGIATSALRRLLATTTARPLHARAARDNVASLRVLQKCGFVVVGHDRGFAEGRGEEVEELILRLESAAPGA